MSILQLSFNHTHARKQFRTHTHPNLHLKKLGVVAAEPEFEGVSQGPAWSLCRDPPLTPVEGGKDIHQARAPS